MTRTMKVKIRTRMTPSRMTSNHPTVGMAGVPPVRPHTNLSILTIYL